MQIKKQFSKQILIFVFMFAISFFLRQRGLIERAPFDWDQSRDYSEVSAILRGNSIVLGPVAKGSGGFHLGSFYYYSLIPAYLIMKGDLAALPLTSVIIDSCMAGLIYLILRGKWGKKKSLILAIIWMLSWTFIDASRTSWNVAYVPIWSLLVIYSMSEIISSSSTKHFYLLALLAGLSVHIHVSAIPLIPILSLIFIRKFKFPLKVWITAIVLAFLPILPLAFYDLTHSFENLKLARMQVSYQNSFKVPFPEMFAMAVAKLGKVFLGIVTAHAAVNSIVGYGVLILSGIAVKSKTNVVKIAGITTLITFVLILLLHDIDFPEYYFSVSYIGMLIVVMNVLFSIPLIEFIVLPILIVLNVRAYQITPTTYSLSIKKELISQVARYPSPIDVRFAVAPGREGGFGFLMDRQGIKVEKGSKTQVMISDDLNLPLYIDGEMAKDFAFAGHLKAAAHIVQ